MVKTVDLEAKLEMVDDGVELAGRVAPMLAQIRAVAGENLGEGAERKALSRLYYRDPQAYSAASAVMGLAKRQVTPQELMFLTEAIECLEQYAAASAVANKILAGVGDDDLDDFDDLDDLKPVGGVN